MSTTRQRVEVYWGDQPPGIEEMAPPAPTGEMIFDPADVGMLGRASGSREAGILPGIGRASAVHGSNVAAIAGATGQSETSVQQNLGDISMPTVASDRGFDARSNRIAHHTNVLQQNRVIKSSTGPWDVFNVYGSGGYSYGGDDEGGEGGAGEGETRPDIAFPPHVETTGYNTKLYEIMMIKGWSQADIKAWADGNGLGFWDAVDQLFAESVPTEWKSPWEQHIEQSGFAEGTSLEEAWAQIGLDPASVELYDGPEGTYEHWAHDRNQGLTGDPFGLWSSERYGLGTFEDGSEKAPLDDEALNAGLDWEDFEDEMLEAEEEGRLDQFLADNQDWIAEATQMPDGTPAIQTGPTKDTVSQEEATEEATEEAEQAPVFDAQAHADAMHDLQQDEWARDQGYRDLAHFFSGDDPEEDEGDFTESVQAAEDFWGVGGEDPTTTWGQEELEKAEPVQKDPVSKGQKKKLTDFERAEKYALGGEDPTTTWGW